MALDIIETELLPSDVIKIKFYRPPNLKYLSGQWVRLACTVFGSNEFHSFTLTSAPHENFLSCHIKAQGPWTWKLRNYFDPCNYNPEDEHPKIRIEGPFGGGNQDWYKFEVAVMVGGGIGVTPYASMLNDLVFGTSTNRYSGVACKKVRTKNLYTEKITDKISIDKNKNYLSPLSNRNCFFSLVPFLYYSLFFINCYYFLFLLTRCTSCGYARRTNTSNGSSTCCVTSSARTSPTYSRFTYL